jgi:hypothetical protein
MDEGFIIEVTYQDKDYSFEARLITIGYTHKFIVVINGIVVNYEPDEERQYRAIVNVSDNIKHLDNELIKIVGDKIQSI